MKRFEIGATYQMRFIGDADLVIDWTVIDRTEKTIKITDGKETKTCKIIKDLSEYNNTETVRPLGKYSMSPILHA